MGWIGSANFTAGGLTGNCEAILQFEDEGAISEMESWFEERWNELECQDVTAALRNYRETRDRDGVARHIESVVDGVSVDKPQHLPDMRERPDRGRSYRFMYFGEDRWATSHTELARRVLLAFAEVDPEFLARFAKKDRERVNSGKRTMRRYVSRNRNDLGQLRNLPEKPLTKDGKWWMANNLQDYHCYQGKTHPGILKMASTNFGVSYGEGTVGRIDFQQGPRTPRPPPGYDKGEEVVVKIGRRAENHLLR